MLENSTESGSCLIFQMSIFSAIMARTNSIQWNGDNDDDDDERIVLDQHA